MHTVVPERSTLHGRFSRELDPVLTVRSGETVRFSTLDVAWGLEQHTGIDTPRAKFEPRVEGRDDGPALCGPVAVEGAVAGGVLEIEIQAVRPAPWGWTFGDRVMGLGEDAGVGDEVALVRWTLDPDAGTAEDEAGHRIALRPFLGTIGLAPAEPGYHLAWPPRRTGGNMDCRELVAGSRLFLPVEVDGGLLSVGDGHGAQGDGEVAGMAIECRMDAVDLRLTARPDLAYAWPRAETGAGWITLGFDESVARAASIAVAEMVGLIAERHGVTRGHALALASAVVDVRITQLVNGVKGAHAVLPRGAIAGGRPAA